jgi:hypothetical protein
MGKKGQKFRPYWVGEREVQKGKKAGIKEPLMALIADDVAADIGLPKEQGFPQSVGGTKYALVNGVVFAERGGGGGEGGGGKSERIVAVARGSKPVTCYLNTEESYTYKSQGKTVTGKRKKSFQIGFPANASAAVVHDFLKKATKVQSFSFGGDPYPILRGGSGAAATP